MYELIQVRTLVFFESPVTQKKDIDVSKILHMKDSGMSNREIARKLKVSEGTIRNRLKK